MRRRFQLATAALATAITFSQMACAKPNTAQSSKTDKQSISLAGGVAIETASIAVSNVVGVATNIFLTKQEVTEALWHEIMGGDTPDAERAALPKAGVSYLDIQEFLRKLNERREVAVPGFAFRLPTAMELVMSIEAGENELDVSGNGGSDTGAPETLLIGGWFAENAEAKRHPVGSAKADENGVSDLLGNVWEMTSTEVSGDDGFVVCLGGSFKQKASRCRSGSEYWYGKTDREDDVGFRLVVIDRAAYLALREQEDRENALAEIKKWMFVAETNLKHAKGMGKIIYNRQLDALNRLQGELEGKKIANGIEGGTREAAQKGDRLVVWKSENNTTEITYDGKSFAFRSTNESEDDFRDAKTESVATIGDAQQTKVFFKKIGDLWNEMIKGASFEMEASFPEIESAEWTYQNASVGKAYGRKRFVELGVRSEGAGRYGKAEWLVLSTTMFKAKEGDWSWMSEIRISEKDVFAIKEKHLVVDDLVAKYARMTGGVLNASGEAAATEVKSNGDISSLVLKLGKDMIMVPNRPFCICKYEVTQALWKALMGGNPSYFKGDDLPVDSVSWDDCQTFIQRLNSVPEVKSANIAYRLPTDEEWEYACRAGKKENDKDFSEYAWIRDAHDRDADTSTHSVGTKKANAYGLYDMIGNVAEWTSDEVIGKHFRNCRGGCFDDSFVGYDMKRARPYCFKGPDVGFRLAHDSIR